MSCNQCYDLCTIFKGSPAQRVGAVSDLNESIIVWITNLGSGRIEVQAVTTDGSGNVDLDFTEDYLESGQTYRIQATLVSYGSDLLDFTPPGQTATYQCLTFSIQASC
jgi:hypothetical protein